ncbi:hypothetical protein Elgi_59330 [Paenibacillus elgii]|uniref:hypothetical protein n=1 Tax=Paenibacillus elgii TaxID=189691 RepID=UPI002D7CCE91|nr:hypothetical protein Elgi_59330 [Paenibacillus elgii]
MKDLLIVEGKLTPLSSKTHITYQFYMPEAAECLVIDFSYSPKKLNDLHASRELIEDAIDQYVNPSLQPVYKEQWEKFVPLQNLLTLSIDDPDGFRGSAHRHPNEQHHVLSRKESSPGFIEGPIQDGIWRVTISVHCVVTEACHYTLSIRGGASAHELASV